MFMYYKSYSKYLTQKRIPSVFNEDSFRQHEKGDEIPKWSHRNRKTANSSVFRPLSGRGRKTPGDRHDRGVMTNKISEMKCLSNGYVQNLLFSAFPMVVIARQAMSTASTARDLMAATRAHEGPARRGLPPPLRYRPHAGYYGHAQTHHRVASNKNAFFI
ncbi:unnamed protein product [Euphydryas editha]|uniref:Uncharacterized protein n=1 Tax=Euphydryas editha TaxID=104508 RepID=A0AAU9V4N6_EUPED|nr:unnamed protein product [Euphydryas editha]